LGTRPMRARLFQSKPIAKTKAQKKQQNKPKDCLPYAKQKYQT
jgi:hypothetical protein